MSLPPNTPEGDLPPGETPPSGQLTPAEPHQPWHTPPQAPPQYAQYEQQPQAYAQQPQPAYAPQPQQPYPHHPYVQRPMSALALIAFISSFFLSLVGIICGHIALAKIKRSGDRGRGFALAGVIIGYVSFLSTSLAIVSVFLFGSASPPEPDASLRGPEGMRSGGAVFGDGAEVISSGAAGGAGRFADEVDRTSGPVDVVIYVDYMCPACGNFELANGEALESRLMNGEITLQVYPLNFLDAQSLGSRYSTRAANLFACTVEYAPDSAFDLHTRLLSPEEQPPEGTEGLTDDELLAIASSAGARIDSDFRSCVTSQRFAAFFDDNTRIATQEGLLGLAPGEQLMSSSGQPQSAGPQRLVSTPTVIISGSQYIAERDGDLGAFINRARDR